MSIELSVSFVSWINDQLRDEIELRLAAARRRPAVNYVRSAVLGGIASVSIVIAMAFGA